MRTELTTRRYRGLVTAVLLAEGCLLLWNAWHYDWLRGYDAFANDRYANIVSTTYRLPSAEESGVWHTPPLWFMLAGALRRLTTTVGWGHAQRPGQLLAAGVEPEEMYRRLYASHPVGRLHLLRDALATLEVDPAYGISWISVAAGAAEEYGLKAEDLDGLAEHPRSVGGTRLAIFFRDLGHGKIKVSFRSTGGVDVNAFARQFGGGGHARASGALIPGTIEEVRHSVIAAAREFTGSLEQG